MIVGRELTRLQQEFPGLVIDKVDILTSPGKALKAGVRMIPTLQAGEQRLSGVFLSNSEIREFVTSVVVGDA
jgi:hypothetical protein